jgi:hypothetical protein
MWVNREEDGRQLPFKTERSYAGLHLVTDDKGVMRLEYLLAHDTLGMVIYCIS